MQHTENDLPPPPPFVEWVIQRQESDDFWLEVRDPSGWRSAIVRCDAPLDDAEPSVLHVEYYRHVAIPLDARLGSRVRNASDTGYQAVVVGMDGEEHPNYDEYFPMQSLDDEVQWMLALRQIALRWFRKGETR